VISWSSFSLASHSPPLVFISQSTLGVGPGSSGDSQRPEATRTATETMDPWSSTSNAPSRLKSGGRVCPSVDGQRCWAQLNADPLDSGTSATRSSLARHRSWFVLSATCRGREHFLAVTPNRRRGCLRRGAPSFVGMARVSSALDRKCVCQPNRDLLRSGTMPSALVQPVQRSRSVQRQASHGLRRRAMCRRNECRAGLLNARPPSARPMQLTGLRLAVAGRGILQPLLIFRPRREVAACS